MDELIKRDLIPISYSCPNHHAAYDDSPRIRHKLPQSNVQVVKKLHNEWMDGKSEVAKECSLIKTNLTMSKGTSLLTLPRRRTLVSSGNWNLSLNLLKMFAFKVHFSLRAWKGWDVAEAEGWEDEGTEEGTKVIVSVPALAMPTLKDEPLSRSLDLTSDPILSLLKTSRTDLNQARDSYNSGYRSPNTKPRPPSPITNSSICGYWSLKQ